MRIVVTGADGFIGTQPARAPARARPRRRRVRHATTSRRELAEAARATPISCSTSPASTARRTTASSRPATPGSPRALCAALRAAGARVPVVYASSTQADARQSVRPQQARRRSRRCARYAARDRRAGATSSACPTSSASGAGPTTTRWSRPSATTSRAACRSRVNDPAAPLTLVYIDDVVDGLRRRCSSAPPARRVREVDAGLRNHRRRGGRDPAASSPPAARSLVTPRVGTGLVRALYATYVSYPAAGRISPTTCRGTAIRAACSSRCSRRPTAASSPTSPRIPASRAASTITTRKTEKFLVIRGTARLRLPPHRYRRDARARHARRRGAHRRDDPGLGPRHHQRRRRRADRHAVGQRNLRPRAAGHRAQ